MVDGLTRLLRKQAGLPERVERDGNVQRFAANIYTRVDLADLQAGIDRLGIPGAAVVT